SKSCVLWVPLDGDLGKGTRAIAERYHTRGSHRPRRACSDRQDDAGGQFAVAEDHDRRIGRRHLVDGGDGHRQLEARRLKPEACRRRYWRRDVEPPTWNPMVAVTPCNR